MDEMIIKTNFMQTIISKIIRKVIKQKTGCNAELKFNEPIQVSFDDDKVKLHISLDAELSKEDLQKLLKDLV